MKPFAGIRVLDFTQFTSGPVCSYILADLGAEVIKIENPPYGDNNHYTAPSLNKHTSYITSLNHNKKCILLNMKNPRQLELFFAMVKDADLVIDNFKAGTLEKFGVTWEKLQETNPRIVWTSIAGYGQTGPWHKRTAYDVTIQGASGLMSVTGEQGGRGVKAGISMSDLTAGMYACCGTAAALLDARRTGRGRRLDVAMIDTSFAVIEQAVGHYLLSGQVDPRMGREHLNFVPYNTYATRDGRDMVLCIRSDGQFAHLCRVLGIGDRASDPRYATNAGRIARRQEVNEFVAAAVARRDFDELLAALRAEQLPCGPILNMVEAMEHPQIAARNMIIPVRYDDGTETKIPGNPIKLSGMEEAPSAFCHDMGQDTIEFLSQYADPAEVHEIFDPILADSREKWAARAARLK